MATNTVFNFSNTLIKEMGEITAIERRRETADQHKRNGVPSRVIQPHRFSRGRRFQAWDVLRQRRKRVGKSPNEPRHVQEHVINRNLWPRDRLQLRRAPMSAAQLMLNPPAGPADARRSTRLQERQAAWAQTHAEAQAQVQAQAQAQAQAVLWDQNTQDVAAVLSENVEYMDCEICNETGDSGTCGAACYAQFLRENVRRFEHSVEVKATGDVMGLGLYLRPTVQNPIKKGQMLGEYLGELLPPDFDTTGMDTMYFFSMDQIAMIDARLKGNYTRFANHHCRPNISVSVSMIGRRRMILFTAARDLIPGEQLFISYGRQYFTGNGLQCTCDAQSQPHTPPK
ncbi:SET domain-containing protein [Apiospora kogelbergensis]|uniref:SET domain-containing protein n=1 Tax=Apiospora kogelbergensis TaxID=1337665 RepID=A0AAW0RAP5_9PEZI